MCWMLLQPKSELSNLPAVRSSSQLRQAIILASGTVQHGLIKEENSEPIPQYEHDICKQFRHQMEDLYKQSSDEATKVAVLKAIGNSGVPEFFNFIEKVLYSQREPLQVRMNAVYAFRRMPQEIAQKVGNAWFVYYCYQYLIQHCYLQDTIFDVIICLVMVTHQW